MVSRVDKDRGDQVTFPATDLRLIDFAERPGAMGGDRHSPPDPEDPGHNVGAQDQMRASICQKYPRDRAAAAQVWLPRASTGAGVDQPALLVVAPAVEVRVVVRALAARRGAHTCFARLGYTRVR